jgi:inhibitor of cysteine peptidase
MKTNFFANLMLALLVGSLAACQSTVEPGKSSNQESGITTTLTNPLKIGAPDAGETVTLKTGDTLLIELDGNITTGFNWIPAPQDPVLLEQVGESEVTPASDLPGAPGKILLQFKAVARGQAVLRLDYKRSWETNVAPEKTFEVTVVVK